MGRLLCTNPTINTTNLWDVYSVQILKSAQPTTRSSFTFVQNFDKKWKIYFQHFQDEIRNMKGTWQARSLSAGQ